MPALSRSFTNSSAHIHRTLVDINCNIKNFGIISEAFSNENEPSVLLSHMLSSPKPYLYGSEQQISNWVLRYMEDIFKLAGLNMDIAIQAALQIVSLSPDHWLVLRNGLPIGVIEVKKPA